jgi:hypothetical protein
MNETIETTADPKPRPCKYCGAEARDVDVIDTKRTISYMCNCCGRGWTELKK